MSFYRQHWRVVLEGFDAPIEVLTSARDSQSIVVDVVDGKPAMPMGMPLKIVHNALMRTESHPDVPRNFQKFLDLVIDADEIEDETAGAAEEMDPTQAEVSAG